MQTDLSESWISHMSWIGDVNVGCQQQYGQNIETVGLSWNVLSEKQQPVEFYIYLNDIQFHKPCPNNKFAFNQQ